MDARTAGVFCQIHTCQMDAKMAIGHWRRDFFCARTQIAKWWSANGRLHISKVMQSYEKSSLVRNYYVSKMALLTQKDGLTQVRSSY